MEARSAWVLNLDADLELSAARYAPRAATIEAMRAPADALAASLLRDGDVRVDADAPADDRARGLRGRAFCPTPRAIAALERVGAIPEPHPSVEVLRRVASRGFVIAALGQTIAPAAFVTDLAAARALLDDDPRVGRAWRVKRAYGMAGRAHRVVAPRPRAEQLAFLPAWVEAGGVQIEPDVAIDREWALHGVIDAAGVRLGVVDAIDAGGVRLGVGDAGGVRLGALTRQRAVRGAWVGSERAPMPEDAAVAAEVERAARDAAGALAAAGYFGPFGVDAFAWRDLEGRAHLRARGEVNARYTMGFATGYGRP